MKSKSEKKFSSVQEVFQNYFPSCNESESKYNTDLIKKLAEEFRGNIASDKSTKQPVKGN